jgi:flagellar motor protein MotB
MEAAKARDQLDSFCLGREMERGNLIAMGHKRKGEMASEELARRMQAQENQDRQRAEQQKQQQAQQQSQLQAQQQKQQQAQQAQQQKQQQAQQAQQQKQQQQLPTSYQQAPQQPSYPSMPAYGGQQGYQQPPTYAMQMGGGDSLMDFLGGPRPIPHNQPPIGFHSQGQQPHVSSWGHNYTQPGGQYGGQNNQQQSGFGNMMPPWYNQSNQGGYQPGGGRGW